MAPSGTITATTVLLCFMLGLFNPTPAASRSHMSKSCCTKYYKTPVPILRIKGYREQVVGENCRMEAIIFYTVAKREICANPKDEWVRRILESLSLRLKNMSKGGSAGKTDVIKKNGNSSSNDGSGAFLTTTESFLNSTSSFY